jgi:hypothetical protein
VHDSGKQIIRPKAARTQKHLSKSHPDARRQLVIQPHEKTDARLPKHFLRDSDDRHRGRLPLAQQLLHPGEALTAIRVVLDCAGLTGIRNVPDGWQYHIDVDGESYSADLLPSRQSSAPPYQAPPLLEITLRGQWSDCYSLRLFARYKAGAQPGSREFVQADFLSKLIESTPSVGDED